MIWVVIISVEKWTAKINSRRTSVSDPLVGVTVSLLSVDSVWSVKIHRLLILLAAINFFFATSVLLIGTVSVQRLMVYLKLSSC